MFEKGQSEEERAAFAAGSLAGSWFVFKLSKTRGTRSSGAAPCPVLLNFSQDERICNGSHKLLLFFHLVVMIMNLPRMHRVRKVVFHQNSVKSVCLSNCEIKSLTF